MKTLFFALAALLPAALASQPVAAMPLNVVEAERAVHVLATWLESEDPRPGDLPSVLRYDQAVVPALIAALNSGPGPARRERLRRSLESGYERLAEQARKDSKRKIPSRDEYLEHYAANFHALYRVRAAQALAAIGGPQARKALEAALTQSKRDDVREAIQQALREIK